MLFKTRLFIVGICILFVLIKNGHNEPKNTTPVNKAERVEEVSDYADLCPEGIQLKTTFETQLWCESA